MGSLKGTEKKSRMIGVLIADLNDSYQGEIWKGISQRASQLDMGLICFPGSRIHSPHLTEETSSRIYHFADSKNLDGLIIISSAIFNSLANSFLLFICIFSISSCIIS